MIELGLMQPSFLAESFEEGAMAEITTKRTGELLRGVFRILEAKPEGLPAKAVLQELGRLVPPTPFEQSTYPKFPDTRRNASSCY